ncbi:protein tesmin/TSO1-like CXC 2 isoform X3 [Miscanthus floridulus]|uniref:protein tesmin/TSO1-like CXC 2 isoform X3 n=1 Tax=Miscanthus floridulus TaxID=154761 RepID=UPI0034581B2F
MDAPESPPAGRPSSDAIALYEHSPIFDFINSLSPIATPKPLGSTQNVQLFKSSNLPPLSSIFTSPQVNPRKESKSTIRDVKLSQEELNPNCQRNQMETFSCIELSGSAALASENCSPSEDATNWPSKWLQFTPFGSETLGDAKKQDTDGKTNHTADVEQVKPSSTYSDQNGLDQVDSSTSGRIVQENELAKQDRNDLAPCSLNHLITHCGTGNSVISISDLALEAQQWSWKLRGDNIIPSTSVLAVDQGNLEDSRREHFVEPFGSYIQSAADDTHVYCADAAAGVATNHDQEMLPAVIQNQLVSNDYNFDTFKVSIDGTTISQQQCGTHRRNLFNDKKTMPNADKSDQQSHKKRRRKLQNNDGESCRHCSCKKSKCLKLYCACFAAKVYCSEFCSCQGCSNNHMHEEAVSHIRKQTESRNPLAFAPTVTRTCGPVSEFGDDSNNTPASARHKRGCNCRKSSCLKKYCECFQSGVGCSISCRCESCKNSFGKREGVLLLTTEKLKKGGKAKGSHGKEEKLAFDKHHVISQSGDLAASENLLATPSLEPYRSSFLLPSTCSKLTPATAGCSSGLHNPRSPMKSDDVLSPSVTRAAAMILGNDFSDIQEVGSSCTTSVKVVSPNKKRVAPLHIGTALSPIGSSSRKLVLKSIPSFPSLTGDADSEPH